MNPEAWLGKRWRAGRYTCWDFVVEILAREFDLALPDLKPERIDAHSALRAILDGRLRFTKIEAPAEPSIVLFPAPPEPHIGLHWQGCVLHLLRDGARYEPLAEVAKRYHAMEHYQCQPA